MNHPTILAALVTGLLAFAVDRPASAATFLVRMANYNFSPTNLVINPGDTVRWTNTTLNPQHDTTHRSAAGPALWSSSLLSAGGAAYSFTFTNAGYYPYMCRTHVLFPGTHPEQTGSVSVVRITLDSMAAFPDGRFQFTVRGGRQGLRSVVEVSSNLTSWSAIRTNVFPVAGTNLFIFTNAPGPGQRFYRSLAIP